MNDSVVEERKHKQLLKLHRSFRFVAFRPGSLLATFGAAAVLSAFIVLFASKILSIHESLRGLLLQWTNIPINGFERVDIFGSASVQAPITSIGSEAWLTPIVYGVVMAVLAAIYFRSKVSRSLVVFGAILLAISAGSAFVNPQAGPSFFAGYWLRYEFILWILLPWIVAILAGIIMPSPWISILWIVAVPAYSVIWSAVRLTFCAGLLFYAGPTFLLFVWSLFGIVAEVLSLCFFYSAIAWQASFLYQRELSWESAHG